MLQAFSRLCRLGVPVADKDDVFFEHWRHTLFSYKHIMLWQYPTSEIGSHPKNRRRETNQRREFTFRVHLFFFACTTK